MNSESLPGLSSHVDGGLLSRVRPSPSPSPYRAFEFQISERALTMSPEKDQYIWRKTISHIEVGMGSGVFPV
jgi:hypothetical protein